MILALLLLANPPGPSPATSATNPKARSSPSSSTCSATASSTPTASCGRSALLSPRAPRTCKLDDGLVPLLGGVVAAGAVVDMQGADPG